MELKLCHVCHEDKPLSDYSFIKDRNRYNYNCKACVARKARDKRAEDKRLQIRFCRNCKTWLSNDSFQQDKAGRSHYECKNCVILLTKRGIISKSVILDSRKLCLECHELKDISHFKPGRGIGDVQAYCSPCLSLRAQRKYKNEKEKYRERSYRWRIDNREVYLAQHRIHQFNRNNLVKAQSDGTVTGKFLIEIYATLNCFYCKRETPASERSLEHVMPLSRGGSHSASNIEMACINCNSSKREKTLKEWNEYKSI